MLALKPANNSSNISEQISGDQIAGPLLPAEALVLSAVVAVLGVAIFSYLLQVPISIPLDQRVRRKRAHVLPQEGMAIWQHSGDSPRI